MEKGNTTYLTLTRAVDVTPHALLILSSARARDISSGEYRWKDVAGNSYTPTYRGNYHYSDGGVSVTVTYEEVGSKFRGTLTASGLKPNFACQLKIEGIHSQPGNELIRSIGRDWSSPSGTIGYLIFDYFITDNTGNTYLEFEQDSSYHVLRTTTQRPPSGDGPIKSTTFTPDTTHLAYAGTYEQKTVDIYGEREGSHTVGNTFLPDGHYTCWIVITEESFHDKTEFGGEWAGAMHAEINFYIYHNYIPELPLGTLTALVTTLVALTIFAKKPMQKTK